jgi:hypothetical protein
MYRTLETLYRPTGNNHSPARLVARLATTRRPRTHGRTPRLRLSRAGGDGLQNTFPFVSPEIFSSIAAHLSLYTTEQSIISESRLPAPAGRLSVSATMEVVNVSNITERLASLCTDRFADAKVEYCLSPFESYLVERQDCELAADLQQESEEDKSACLEVAYLTALRRSLSVTDGLEALGRPQSSEAAKHCGTSKPPCATPTPCPWLKQDKIQRRQGTQWARRHERPSRPRGGMLCGAVRKACARPISFAGRGRREELPELCAWARAAAQQEALRHHPYPSPSPLLSPKIAPNVLASELSANLSIS